MVNVIDPKVEVVDYGPKKVLDSILDVPFEKTDKGIVISSEYFQNGQLVIPQDNLIPNRVMTPDQLIYAAAGITFKDTGFLEQALGAMQSENITDEQVTDSLITSVGGGHASLATTPAIWFAIKGNSSKMVDSMFTGAVYESALMPSSRRVPIDKYQIVVPRGIIEKGQDAVNLYMKTSEANIDAYERLMQDGVPKEEAAKIVQYGHRGGGFLFMPLETVVTLARDIKNNPNAVPVEGHEVIAQVEDFIREHGMEKTYFGRVNAPREGFPNPGIFHFDYKLTGIINEDRGGVQESPILVEDINNLGPYGDLRIKEYLEKRKKLFSRPQDIEIYWKEILGDLNGIVKELNNNVTLTTIANSPWRVWGEVKRHRTLRQSAESVYFAAERAMEVINNTGEYVRNGENDDLGMLIEEYSLIFSMPPSVTKENEKLKFWLNRIVDSFETYSKLKEMGVEDRDAVHVIPRGLKIGIEKKFDFYNLTLGYMSLRLCNTCEPEMRKTTEEERKLMMRSKLSEEAKLLLTPKCYYVGFCPEGNYDKRCCKKVASITPEYSKELHDRIQSSRKREILFQIQGKK